MVVQGRCGHVGMEEENENKNKNGLCKWSREWQCVGRKKEKGKKKRKKIRRNEIGK